MARLTDDDGVEWVGQDKRVRRLNTARDGVHTVMSFQCEICWCRNLANRDLRLPRDEELQQCIRRVNLDAFASRAHGTIISHVGGVKNSIKLSNRLNKPPSISQTPRGPLPLGDPVGMSLAIEMVLHSVTAKGRIKEHIQYDTMRGLRSTFTKCYDSSIKGIMEGNSFAKGTGQIRPTSCGTQSVFLADFLIGSQDRMGYDTNNQMGLPIKLVVLMLTLVKQDAAEKDEEAAGLLHKFGALIALLTAASLRGHEGLYLDLAGTRKHLLEGQGGVIPNKFSVKGKGILTEEEIDRLPFVTVCLLGKFKGETGERYHSIILASNTVSGIEVRWWMEQVLMVCASEGRSTGYVFAGTDGSPPESSEYNALFRQYLRRIQFEGEESFPPSEDISRYGISRSLRKTAVTRASRAGVGSEIVEAINRWRTVENAKGTRPKHNMRNHYTDARALAPMTWRYAYVL